MYISVDATTNTAAAVAQAAIQQAQAAKHYQKQVNMPSVVPSMIKKPLQFFCEVYMGVSVLKLSRRNLG